MVAPRIITPVEKKREADTERDAIVFLELLDAMKHTKRGDWTPPPGGRAGDAPFHAACKMMSEAMRAGVSVNALVRKRIPMWRTRARAAKVPVPFHTLGWEEDSYLCDENIDEIFGGVRPWKKPATNRKLVALPGVHEATTEIAARVPGGEALLEAVRGETTNDGRLLAYAAEGGLRLVTADVIMATRFVALVPDGEVAIPVSWGSWAVRVYRGATSRR